MDLTGSREGVSQSLVGILEVGSKALPPECCALKMAHNLFSYRAIRARLGLNYPFNINNCNNCGPDPAFLRDRIVPKFKTWGIE